MTEYINKEDAIKVAEKYGTTNGSVLGTHSGVADCIAAEIYRLPAADVMPVIRCKDCVHSHRIDGAKEEYDCRKLSYFSERLPPYHFCSYGEKMNGGANGATD